MNKTLEDQLVYGLARWTNVAFGSLPNQDLDSLSDKIAACVFNLDKRHRQRTLDHLAIAFPEKTDDERSHIARQCLKHVITLGFEVLTQDRNVQEHRWNEHLSLGEGCEFGLELMSQKKPIILATGHLGNWEMLGQGLAQMGFQITSVARKLNHPTLSRWVFGIREKQGMRIVLKENATRHLTHDLKAGRHAALVADQSAGKSGIFVPFFGKLASTFKSFSTLALKFDIPVICGAAFRVEPWRYQIHIEDVIDPQECRKKSDPVLYMTARYSRAVEKMARKYPDQYFWMHRRWKTRPKYERDGIEMPDTMREKLKVVEDELQLDNVA